MEDLIIQAVKCLKNSGLVSLPTETVYSLSANAFDDVAVERIYQLKGRSKDNPLALLVGGIASAMEIVEFNLEAEILAQMFFPGALTLILPKKKNTRLSTKINEGLDSLAVRMPNHALTLAVLNALDFPIIGTSANPSGLPPALDAAQVIEYFKDKLDLIIDGGKAEIGVASTIIDLTMDKPVILRQGGVSKEQIEAALNIRL